MKLVPCSTVRVIYAEHSVSAIKKPVLSMSDGMIYFMQARGGAEIPNCSAEVQHLSSYEASMMAYYQYRLTAVESS